MTLRKLLCLGLLCFASAARGEEATAEVATPTESEATPTSFDAPSYKKRPYVVSLGLRGEYDDNIFTSEDAPISSFKIVIEPELAFNVSDSRTLFAARYRHNTIYYDNRPGDQFDYSHFFDVNFNHEFSSRLAIDISDKFRYTQEAELTQDAALIRRFGNYMQNSFRAGASYYLTRRVFLSLSAGHDWWDYEDEIYSQLDREIFTGGTGLNFQVSPVTLTGIYYNYIVTEFKNSPRDSDAHQFYAGLLQTFTPQWTASIQGGGEYRKAELSEGEVSPFAAATTTYYFLPSSSFTAGYNISLQDTDLVNFNYSQSQHIFGSVTSQLTYDLKMTLGADYIITEYPSDQAIGGIQPDAEERTLVYRIGFTYRFTPHLFGDLGYSYTTVDSDFLGRSYDRNLGSAGIRYVY